MATEVTWRARHSAVGFDDWAFVDGLLLGEIVRYPDIDHEHGHEVRGHWFAGFARRQQLDGRFESVVDAQAAVEAALVG